MFCFLKWVKGLNVYSFVFRWLQSLTMEVILSTAFGVKAETQTVENDPITEYAKKAMGTNTWVGILCKKLLK